MSHMRHVVLSSSLKHTHAMMWKGKLCNIINKNSQQQRYSVHITLFYLKKNHSNLDLYTIKPVNFLSFFQCMHRLIELVICV